MKKNFLVFAVFVLTALVLFGCVQKPSPAATPSTTTSASGSVDSSLDSFDASLDAVSNADSELNSTMPGEFDVSLVDES